MDTFDSTSVELPIIGCAVPCTVNKSYSKWFSDKDLYMDDVGVCYAVMDAGKWRRFYVHDQVMILAVKDGLKPDIGKKRTSLFVKARGDPDVRKYYFGKK